MQRRTNSKSSSGVIMIHHPIMYLEIPSYAHHLTRQTTTTKEIPLTDEIPAVLNSGKQWTSCPGTTVLLRSRLWVCIRTSAILAYSLYRKKNYPRPIYRDVIIGRSQRKWNIVPRYTTKVVHSFKGLTSYLVGFGRNIPSCWQRLKQVSQRN